MSKGALTCNGKLTLESVHAWNLIIICYFIVWDMTFIFMVHLSFYAIPLLIYDVMNDITIIPKGTKLKPFLKLLIYHVMLLNNYTRPKRKRRE